MLSAWRRPHSSSAMPSPAGGRAVGECISAAAGVVAPCHLGRANRVAQFVLEHEVELGPGVTSAAARSSRLIAAR